MTKEEGKIKVDGLVIEALPGTQFRVRLDNGRRYLHILREKCVSIISVFCWAITYPWKCHLMT